MARARSRGRAWPAAARAGALLLALAVASLAQAPARFVRDQVGLFTGEQVGQMERRLGELERETGFAAFVEARSFEGFEGFTQEADRVFEEIVERAGHYRVALVLIGIDRETRRGMVGTNLGAGLYQVMTREAAADLFLAEGEAFSAERIGEGVDRLASKLEEWHSLREAETREIFGKEPRSWHQRLGVPFYPILGVGLLVLWAAAWAAWRSRACPGCGAALRVRVRWGGPGGTAVRTAKCFECGHVEKNRFERRPWLASGRGRRRGTPEA